MVQQTVTIHIEESHHGNGYFVVPPDLFAAACLREPLALPLVDRNADQPLQRLVGGVGIGVSVFNLCKVETWLKHLCKHRIQQMIIVS